MLEPFTSDYRDGSIAGKNVVKGRTDHPQAGYNRFNVMHTILVIEDDEALRDTVGLLLEREGFRPVLVADGKAGLEQAMRLKPSLMLVDLRAPGMNGLEICRELRNSRMQFPIIVLSAVGDEIDKVLLLEVGADDYISQAIRHSRIARSHQGGTSESNTRRVPHVRIRRCSGRRRSPGSNSLWQGNQAHSGGVQPADVLSA